MGRFVCLYLQVEELAVPPVDDVGGRIRVGDVDEVHLQGGEDKLGRGLVH